MFYAGAIKLLQQVGVAVSNDTHPEEVVSTLPAKRETG